MFARAGEGSPQCGFSSMSSAIKKEPPRWRFFFVAKLGLEPRQTEPESVVLPLHHLANA